MNGGLNQNVEFEGTTYHIQIENKEKQNSFEVRVYVEGMILFRKLHSYFEKIDGLTSQEEIQKNVEEELKKLFLITKVAIERGKIKKI